MVDGKISKPRCKIDYSRHLPRKMVCFTLISGNFIIFILIIHYKNRETKLNEEKM